MSRRRAYMIAGVVTIIVSTFFLYAQADSPPPALMLKTPEAEVLMQGGRNEDGICVVKLTITDRATKRVLMDGLVACEMLEKLLRMTRGETDV